MGRPLSELQLLAIILYTDTDLIYKDLRKSEILGNRCKWPVFSTSLYQAIMILGASERKLGGIYTNYIHSKVYSGMSNVVLTKENFLNPGIVSTNGTQIGNYTLPSQKWYNLPTFTSFSRQKRIAEQFRGNNGTIIEASLNKIEIFAADVSWISRYAEDEILIAKYVPIAVTKGRVTKSRVTGGHQQTVSAYFDATSDDANKNEVKKKFQEAKGYWYQTLWIDLQHVLTMTGVVFAV